MKTHFARICDHVAHLKERRTIYVSDGSCPSNVLSRCGRSIDFFASPSKRINFWWIQFKVVNEWMNGWMNPAGSTTSCVEAVWDPVPETSSPNGWASGEGGPITTSSREDPLLRLFLDEFGVDFIFIVHSSSRQGHLLETRKYPL